MSPNDLTCSKGLELTFRLNLVGSKMVHGRHTPGGMVILGVRLTPHKFENQAEQNNSPYSYKEYHLLGIFY